MHTNSTQGRSLQKLPLTKFIKNDPSLATWHAATRHILQQLSIRCTGINKFDGIYMRNFILRNIVLLRAACLQIRDSSPPRKWPKLLKQQQWSDMAALTNKNMKLTVFRDATPVTVRQAPIFRSNLRPPFSDCKNYCKDSPSMFLRNTGTCPPNNKTPCPIRTQSPSRTTFMSFNLRKHNCWPKNSDGLSLSTLSIHHQKASYFLKLIKWPSKAYYKKFTSDINSLFNIT